MTFTASNAGSSAPREDNPWQTTHTPPLRTLKKEDTEPKIIDLESVKGKPANRAIQGYLPPLSSPSRRPPATFVPSAVNSIIEAQKKENSPPPQKGAPPDEDLNPDFVVSLADYARYWGKIESIILSMRLFDVREFLIGLNHGEHTACNKLLLDSHSLLLQNLANEISKEENTNLEIAFKKIIGLIDLYDLNQSAVCRNLGISPLSTFPIRSLALLASNRAGAPLASWEAYTKKGKPKGSIWPFVEKWKNWVPEAQGAMAKFSEGAIIKSDALAKKHPENVVVLLKGGFGSGKTRQAKELFKENAEGVLSPDKGKTVVRRSMKEILHSAAHVQGSQLAFALFEELSLRPGTAVYDSSLGRPDDIRRYLAKCDKAGKKTLVIDVARKDIARIFSVLKREVGGEDPRIPVKMIVDGTLRDKLLHVECIKQVLEHTPSNPENSPEYHLIASDSQGWNTKRSAILTPGKVLLLEEGRERLEQQGIRYLEASETFEPMHTEESLKQYFAKTLDQSVSSLMQEISSEERAELEQIFSKRVLSFKSLPSKGLDKMNFYSCLSDPLQKAWTQKEAAQALGLASEDALANFFDAAEAKIRQGLPVSYLDLPLSVALELHQALKIDPWTMPNAESLDSRPKSAA